MSGADSRPPGGRGAEQPHNIATAIAEVSERATLLVREEIELAKVEVTEKAIKLLKGAVVGVVAGVFFVTALLFALVGFAWLLYYFLPGGDFTYFWGFFAMAAILVALGVLAGLMAARAVKKGAPPVPNMAIEEARKIRETVSAPSADGSAAAAWPAQPAPGADAPVAAPMPAPVDVAAEGPSPPPAEPSEPEAPSVESAEPPSATAEPPEPAPPEARPAEESDDVDADSASSPEGQPGGEG